MKENLVPTRTRKPIPYCSFGGFRPFSSYWWKDVRRYIVRGWWYDLHAYWHRARYGWAPRDVWSLDNYLNDVLGATLEHLANTTNGTPAGYPFINPKMKKNGEPKTNHKMWEHDLKRWGRAFDDLNWWDENDHHFPRDNDPNWYAKYRAVDEFFSNRAQKALKQMAPWWRGLWD